MLFRSDGGHDGHEDDGQAHADGHALFLGAAEIRAVIINDSSMGLCHACFSGKYPMEVPECEPESPKNVIKKISEAEKGI